VTGDEARFCSACGKPRQPGARFCSYCGGSISDQGTGTVRGAAMELCEIEMEVTKRGLDLGSGIAWGRSFRLTAVSSGPTGRCVVDASQPLPNGFVDKRFDSELAALADRLLRSGWQPMPSAIVADGVRLPRFQRAIAEE